MCRHGDTRECLVNIPATMSHTGEERWEYKPIDRCIAGIVDALNAQGILTAGCCCGHGEAPGSIILQDGTRIVVPVEYEVPRQWLHPADPARRAGMSGVTFQRGKAPTP